MQDTGEELLQIDAFAEAVGRDQDPRLVAGHLRNALLANVVRVFAGDNPQVKLWVFLAKGGLEVLAKILRCFDVTAEDDRVEPLLDPLF